MAPKNRVAQISSHLSGKSVNTSSSSQNAASVTTTSSSIPNSTGVVVTITLSNLQKLNVVSSYLLKELTRAFSDITASPDPQLRAVVLTSAAPPPNSGKAPSFIGGAYIDEMFRLPGPKEAREFISQLHDLGLAMRACPVPVIARCHGFCLGGGLGILAACDLRLATAESVFGMPEVKVGVPSVVGARLLPDLIGWGRARRLLLLGDNIDATTAQDWGLLDDVAEDVAALDTMVERYATHLAQNGAGAVREQKRLIRQWENMHVDEGIKVGIDAFGKSYEDGGKEPKELMGRFLNRKK